MKAAVYRRYGSPDVVQIEDVEKPVPKDNEVLIKVCAASVNPLDGGLMKGQPHCFRILFGLRKPRLSRPGVDVAGQVEAVGRNVTQFKPGDHVFGSCRGAFAEYACTSESKLAMKPDNVTFEQAASVPIAGITALQGLRDKGKIESGQKVLINGASGGVGTFAVQIAKSFGADVTGVCSTKNLDMVRSLGAGQVIDYTKEDFARSGETYDIIFDAVGKRSATDRRRALAKDGVFLSYKSSADVQPQDLTYLKAVIEAGEVKAAIDRCYPLEQIVEAHRYVDTGHKRGNVVITLGHRNMSR